ncbi:UDP-forming cellulose synthase catalytic subunit [Ensifer sp. SL37]|uniref:UDP-forming cellulose synthase catalytic subunit n=1 Tax=Ensifer sp. SL37 TaxID=2995137 RepID=UPI003FA34B28
MVRALTIFLWVFVSLGFLALITLPISLQTQFAASLVIAALMGAIKLVDTDGKWRSVALAFGTAIILRYVYWRTTATLPPAHEWQNFIPAFLLYLAEMYGVTMLVLSLFVVAMPLPARPLRGAPSGNCPKVDVFVPSYNEDPELLANTLAAAKSLDYPSDCFTVWLLDDGGTDQKRESENLVEARHATERRTALEALCAGLGVQYLTRARNEHAKAGNLNNGMKHSKGELVAVFDADHAPARDFLLQTVGYFDDDPRLFLVQTPHFFLNPDPIERNLHTFEKMPSENEMFYGIIQRGLDKWNAAFFCGSAAVLRREALDEVNGFSGMSVTEDCETALTLHARGWNSVYVDRPLVAGLQPATFASFIGQRSRWAQGMLQILLLRSPLIKRGLSLSQRLCYLSSMLFWLFPFSRMTFLVAPLFYLFFGLQIFTASGDEFVAYTLGYMLVNMTMQNYLYGPFRWPWISQLYEYVQTLHLLPAVISVLVSPRKPTFRVTAKDESILKDRLSEISWPFFVVFAVLTAAFAATIYRLYAQPYKADVTIVVGGWNLLNLVMAGCSLGVVAERSELTLSRRVKVNRRCEFRMGRNWLPAKVDDVSASGARIQIYGFPNQDVAIDAEGEIRFVTNSGDGTPEVLPVLVRNFEKTKDLSILGLRYVPKTASHYRLVADLIFANSRQWTEFQQARRGNPGLVRGTLWFLRLAFYQTGRGFHYLLRAIGAKGSATQ